MILAKEEKKVEHVACTEKWRAKSILDVNSQLERELGRPRSVCVCVCVCACTRVVPVCMYVHTSNTQHIRVHPDLALHSFVFAFFVSTPLANLHFLICAHFRFNSLWLVYLHGLRLFSQTGIPFFIYAHFFRNAIRAWHKDLEHFKEKQYEDVDIIQLVQGCILCTWCWTCVP